MQTMLDQIANRNHLQLIKAVVPYLPGNRQKTFSVLIKMLELRNVLQFYCAGEPAMAGRQASGTPPDDPLEILSDLRNYCDEGEQAALDRLIQILGMAELYSTMAQSEGGFSPETIMTLFQDEHS